MKNYYLNKLEFSLKVSDKDKLLANVHEKCNDLFKMMQDIRESRYCIVNFLAVAQEQHVMVMTIKAMFGVDK